MRIFLLGKDATTRRKQAELLSNMYSVPQISDQDLISDGVSSDAPLKGELQKAIDSGAAVPEPVMMALVKRRMHQGDCYNGFLIEGFPTTVDQAQTLVDQGVSIDFVIELLDPNQDPATIVKPANAELFIYDDPRTPSYILHSLVQKNHH